MLNEQRARLLILPSHQQEAFIRCAPVAGAPTPSSSRDRVSVCRYPLRADPAISCILSTPHNPIMMPSTPLCMLCMLLLDSLLPMHSAAAKPLPVSPALDSRRLAMLPRAALVSTVSAAGESLEPLDTDGRHLLHGCHRRRWEPESQPCQPAIQRRTESRLFLVRQRCR